MGTQPTTASSDRATCKTPTNINQPKTRFLGLETWKAFGQPTQPMYGSPPNRTGLRWPDQPVAWQDGDGEDKQRGNQNTLHHLKQTSLGADAAWARSFGERRRPLTIVSRVTSWIGFFTSKGQGTLSEKTIHKPDVAMEIRAQPLDGVGRVVPAFLALRSSCFQSSSFPSGSLRTCSEDPSQSPRHGPGPRTRDPRRRAELGLCILPFSACEAAGSGLLSFLSEMASKVRSRCPLFRS